MHSRPSEFAALPRTVVITGGTSGIGLAVARFFAEQGSKVGIIGRSPERVTAAVEALTLEGVVHGASADVTDEEAIEGAVDTLAGELGGVDALVCCAGIDGEVGSALRDVTAEGFREVLDVNVVGTFLAVKHTLPHLRNADGSSVTIIGSDSGFVATTGMLAYNASKGALAQMTRALALELFDDYGIRVNSVCPSIVDTPMARRYLDDALDGAAFPVQTADDVAWSVGYLTSRRSRAVNGVNLLSDFGYSGRSSFPA